MPPAAVAQLREVVDPVCTAAGYDLEDLEMVPAGRRSVVRVVVDRDGGVDLDAVAELSRAVSEALDADDRLGQQAYVLEVTSRGVDRPLTLPRHWRRAVGRLVEAGEVSGRVVAVDDDGVTFDVTGEPSRVGFEELAVGRVQVEFRRTQEVG